MANPGLQRAVLAAEVTRDDIDDAMTACELHLTNVIPGNGELPAQLIFSASATTHVYVIEDARLGVLYAAVAGDPDGHVLDKVQNALPTVSDEAAAALDTFGADDEVTLEELRPMLAACVLAAPDAPRTRKRIEAVLAHSEAAVRQAALIAITYAPSRAFYSALARVRDSDDNVDLQRHAKRVLDSILGGTS